MKNEKTTKVDKVGEIADKVYGSFSELPKEVQRKVAYRLNWKVKKLFEPSTPKVKKEKKKVEKK